MKSHSRIELPDGSFISRPDGSSEWKPLPAPGKLLTGSLAIKAARDQNKAVAPWMAGSINEHNKGKRKPANDKK